MKYLVLKFRNAKFIPTHKATKDFCFDVYRNSKKKRVEQKTFIEPITLYQISNMFHVLFGERPVPTHRSVFYKRNEYYFDKAKNSYLLIETPKEHHFKDNKDYYIKEKLRTTKAVYDSWNPQVYITWEKLRRYFSEYYEEFTNLLKKLFEIDPAEMSVADAKNIIIQKDDVRGKKELISFCTSIKKSAFKDFLLESNDTALSKTVMRINKDNNIYNAITVVNGIDSAIVLSGTLLVPVTDFDLERLSNYSGTARLLDGGFVYVYKIVDENELSIDNFIKVDSISTEMK